MRKKVLSLMVVMAMVLSFMPIIAIAAQNGACGINLTWTLDNNGTLTISGEGDMWEYHYYSAPWAQDSMRKIQSLVIEDGVTSIGSFAFYDCDNLENVAIGNDVTSIGNSAFSECDRLKSITIPNSVTSIDYRAFAFCTSLKSVILGEGVSSIDGYAFSFCENLENIEVKENNQYYSSSDGILFNKDKTELILYPSNKIEEEYTIPDSVTVIGYKAFWGCINLFEITIPESVVSIYDGAFANCSVTSIIIPKSVISIGDAFWDCDNLESIEVDENNQYYSSYDGVLFNKDNTELLRYPIGKDGVEYNVPDGVTSIGIYAFENCILEEISIPDSVLSIGDGAFNYSALKEITIPDSVESIGGGAFEGCKSLSSVTLGSGITSIGDYEFFKCSSLDSIVIPGSVESIGGGAFGGCTRLNSIVIPDSVKSIRAGAFDDTEYYMDVSNWDDDILYIGNHLIYASYEITDCEIKDGTVTIADYAFYNMHNLESVTIPDSVIGIGSGAFQYCETLKSITLGSGVTLIGDNAFSGCGSLEDIIITDSLLSIGYGAFWDCNSLTDVYYTGTQEQWGLISIGEDNESLTSAEIHYNYAADFEEIASIGYYADKVDVKKAVEGGKVTVKLTSDTEDLEGAQLYIVTVSADGVIDKVNKGTSNTSDGEVTITADIPDTPYKFVLWDKDMTPIINPVTD